MTWGDEETPLMQEQDTDRVNRRQNGVFHGAAAFAMLALACWGAFALVQDKGGSKGLEAEVEQLRKSHMATVARLESVISGKPVDEKFSVRGWKTGHMLHFDAFPDVSKMDAKDQANAPAYEADIIANVVPLYEFENTVWFWVAIVVGIIAFLLWVGTVREAYAQHCQLNEMDPDDLPWWRPRGFLFDIRKSDTFKQLCHYNPLGDPDQAPGRGNVYRLMAVVGPHICSFGEDAAGRELKWMQGFKYTLPTVPAYMGMVMITLCCIVMQIYVPYKLVTGSQEFTLLGLKRINYYEANWKPIVIGMIPLTLVGAKFFVLVEKAVRDELNQCSMLYRAIANGKITHQSLGSVWMVIWVTISWIVNVYVAFMMMFYVVISIATFDRANGDLMDFILGVVGSLGMMGFDDGIITCLPMWGNWYQEHTYWHPQGSHPNGCFIDDALGDTPEGQPEPPRECSSFPPPGYEVRAFDMTGYNFLGFQIDGNVVTAVNSKHKMSMLYKKQTKNVLNPGERIFGIRVRKGPGAAGGGPKSPGSPSAPKTSGGWQRVSDQQGIKEVFRVLKGTPGKWDNPRFDMLINIAPKNPRMTSVKSGLEGCCQYMKVSAKEERDGKKLRRMVTDEDGNDDERDVVYKGAPVWTLKNSIFDQIIHDMFYVATRVATASSLIYILTAYYIDPKTGRHVGI